LQHPLTTSIVKKPHLIYATSVIVALDAHGKPASVQINALNQDPVLNASLQKQAMLWRYDPCLSNGQPVACKEPVRVYY